MGSDSDRPRRSSRVRLAGVVLGLCVVGALVAAVRFWSPPTGPGGVGSRVNPSPVVEVVPPIFEVGTVLQAQTVQGIFELVNRSSNELRIVGMRSGCGCVSLSTGLVGRVLRPQERCAIEVAYASGSGAGPFMHFVEVLLDGGGTRYRAEGLLRGEVRPDYIYGPMAVDFGTLYPGQAAVRQVVFRPYALEQLELSLRRLPAEPFAVELVKQQLSNVISISFRAPAERRSRTFSDTLWVETSSPRVPQVQIPVRARVVAEVEVVPSLLVLPGTPPAGESHFTVLTKDPARVRQVVLQSGQGLVTAAARPAGPEGLDAWAVRRRFWVSNVVLAAATQMVLELELQHGAGRPEARSVSVPVIRLRSDEGEHR